MPIRRFTKSNNTSSPYTQYGGYKGYGSGYKPLTSSYSWDEIQSLQALEKAKQLSGEIPEATSPLRPTNVGLTEEQILQSASPQRQEEYQEMKGRTEETAWYQKALQGLNAATYTASGAARYGLAKIVPGEGKLERVYREAREGTLDSQNRGVGIAEALRIADETVEGRAVKTPFDNVNIFGLKVLPSEISWRGVTRVALDPLNIVAFVPGVGLPLRGAGALVTGTARGAFGAAKGLAGSGVRGAAAGAARGYRKEFSSILAPERATIKSAKSLFLSRAERDILNNAKIKGKRGEVLKNIGTMLFSDTENKAAGFLMHMTRFKAGANKPFQETRIVDGEKVTNKFYSVRGIAKHHNIKAKKGQTIGQTAEEIFEKELIDSEELGKAWLPSMVEVIESGGAKVILNKKGVKIKQGTPQSWMEKFANYVDPTKAPTGVSGVMRGAAYVLNRIAGPQSFGRIADPYAIAAIGGHKMRMAAQDITEQTGNLLLRLYNDVAEHGGRQVRNKSAGSQTDFSIKNIFDVDETGQYITGIRGGYQFGKNHSLRKEGETAVVTFLAMAPDEMLRKLRGSRTIAANATKESADALNEKVVHLAERFQDLSAHTLKQMRAAGLDVTDITESGGTAAAFFPRFVETIHKGMLRGEQRGRALNLKGGTAFKKRTNDTKELVNDFIDAGGRYDVDNLVELMTSYVGNSYSSAADAKIVKFISQIPEFKRQNYRNKSLKKLKDEGLLDEKNIRDEAGNIILVKMPLKKGRAPSGVQGLFHPIWDAERVKNFSKILDLGELSKFDKITESFAKYAGVTRTTQAGLDLGWWMIQGLPQLLLTPEKWGRNVKTVLGTILPEGVGIGGLKATNVVKRHNDLIVDAWKRGTIDEMRKGTVQLSRFGTDIFESTREGGPLFFLKDKGKIRNWAASVAEKPTTFFQRRFELSNDIVRIDTWETFKPVYYRASQERRQRIETDIKNDPGLNPTEVNAEIEKALGVTKSWEQELGEFVRAAAGGFDSKLAGITASQQRLERAFLFYSPRYTRASMALISHVFKDDVTGEMSEMLFKRMLTAGLVTHYNMAKMMGQEPNLDPSNYKFLTLDINGNRVGPGGFWLSAARLFGETLEDPKSVYRGQDGTIGFKEGVRTNPIVKFFRGRSAPLGSTMVDQLVFGSDYLGREFEDLPDRLQHIALDMAPFSLDAAVMEPRYRGGMSGLGQRLTAGATSFSGFRQFPISTYDILNDMRDSLAHKYHGKDWNKLTRVEQKLIEKNQADNEVRELESLELYMEEEDISRGTPRSDREERSKYFRERKEIQEAYISRIDIDMKNWEMGATADGKDGFDSVAFLTKVLRPALIDKRNENERLREKYPNVIAYFAGVGPREDEAPEDVIYRIYMDTIGDLDKYVNPVTREVDFIQRDIDIKEFYDSWGEAGEFLRGYIDSRRQIESNHSKVNEYDLKVDSYFQGLETYRYYWDDIPKLVIDNRQDRDMAGQIYNEWQQANETNRELMEADEVIGPVIRSLRRDISKVRLERRKIDPLLDAWLYRWDFTDSLQHEDNKEYGVFIRDYHYDRALLP